MIVVAIVGILSVLAIYGVRKYIANAKTAEARNSLGQIAKDAAAAVEREKGSGAILTQGNSSTLIRGFCGSASLVPGSIGAVKGQKYQSNVTDWNSGDSTTGWTCLKFSMEEPQYYQYGYTGTPDPTAGGFEADANGDLNGDGNPSQFSVFGSALNGAVAISPSIRETNPDE